MELILFLLLQLWMSKQTDGELDDLVIQDISVLADSTHGVVYQVTYSLGQKSKFVGPVGYWQEVPNDAYDATMKPGGKTTT